MVEKTLKSSITALINIDPKQCIELPADYGFHNQKINYFNYKYCLYKIITTFMVNI